jgi:U3 small nucleolar RNA-associated protein 21
MYQWAIDAVDGVPKVVRSRVGHSQPPVRVRHYRSCNTVATMASGADAVACEVLSASRDRSLRMFHTALDRQNRELSQGALGFVCSAAATYCEMLQRW